MHCHKTQSLSLYLFTIIFQCIVPKPKVYLYTFLPLYFRTLSQNPMFISIAFYHYISVHCHKTQSLSLYLFTIIFPCTVPKPKDYLYTFLPLYFRALPQNPKFIFIPFYHYISVHFPKTQSLSLYLFTIIFPYTVPKPNVYLYSFLPLYFRALSQNPKFIFIPFYHYISVHFPKTQSLSLYLFTIMFPCTVPKPEQSRASQLVNLYSQ